MKLLLLAFFALTSCMHAQETVIKIQQLHQQQLSADMQTYQALEQQLEDIYQQEKSIYHAKPWYFIAAHAIPYLVWQLLFLVLWWCITLDIARLLKRRLLFLVLIGITTITGFFVAVGYYELHTHYFIVPNHTTVMRLGPGNDYAPRMSLAYLTPAIIKQHQGDWLLVDYHGTTGWLFKSGN